MDKQQYERLNGFCGKWMLWWNQDELASTLSSNDLSFVEATDDPLILSVIEKLKSLTALSVVLAEKNDWKLQFYWESDDLILSFFMDYNALINDWDLQILQFIIWDGKWTEIELKDKKLFYTSSKYQKQDLFEIMKNAPNKKEFSDMLIWFFDFFINKLRENLNQI